MATDAQLITLNNQLLFKDFNKANYDIAVRQTAVILGDSLPTKGERARAIAKRDRIAARAAVSASSSAAESTPGGEVLTPFDSACIAGSSVS